MGGIANNVRLVPIILLPPRDGLIALCDARFAAMVEGGALDEARKLLARDLDPALPVMRAIGVPELAAHLRGEASLAEATEAGCLATRRYVKRQYTWFRNQPPEAWLREATTFDNAFINDLAIKLRDMTLT